MRPKILYLTHRLPHPPNRGDRIRSYNTLRFLAERATVDLACLADEPAEPESHQVLQSLCRRIAISPVGKVSRWVRAAGSLASGRSATERLFFRPELFRTLESWSQDTNYDAVIAFCSSMAPYLTAGRLSQVPAYVDLVDVDSQKWFDYAGRAYLPLRWLLQWEGNRLRKYEQSIAARAKGVFLVSSAEAALFKKIAPSNVVHAVANGVDTDYFQPAETAGVVEGPVCVFVGVLDYRANVDGLVWFCNQVWPRIRATHPTAEVKLVGRRPNKSVKQLATIPGVHLIGEVEDVRPYLHSSRVVIAPLRIARGIQNKVLEALSAGKPVIASPQALEGLDVLPGKNVWLAESADQWVAGLTHLFSDQDECRRLGIEGRQFATTNHRWSSCLKKLESIIPCLAQLDSSDGQPMSAAGDSQNPQSEPAFA